MNQRVQSLIERVEETLAKRSLLADGEAALVAVSGGVDSMVLLHLLHALASKCRWRLVVAHFNHRLRGVSANADERLVKRTAARLKLSFASASADVRGFARNHKISVEMAARQLRHDFLARAARERNAGKVVLAHHADDRNELLLLRLLRGAAAEGLAGMRWQAPSPVDRDITLVRPLLNVTKAELIEEAMRSKVAFREDASNNSTDALRNRIRRKLLPLLREEYQPGIDAVLTRQADLLRDDADFIQAEVRRWMETNVPKFDQLPTALQRRVLQVRMQEANVPPTFELIEKLRRRPGEWINTSPECHCRRTDEGMVEVQAIKPSPSFSTDEMSVDLTEGRTVRAKAHGHAAFGGLAIGWSIAKGCRLPQARTNRESFDADAVGRRIVLRHWRAGDRFQPIGLQKPAKLQDLFVNARIPREKRRSLVVATTEAGEIFWVQELRISERFKITSATERRLDWTCAAIS